jgi:pyridinium-3,5-biscarboxylic acid mononucleotide sulfurtransferase
VAPLQIAGLSKTMIRQLSRESGLETSEQPSSPCLSSRIAYGEQVTREKLSAVEQAEAILKQAGFGECRVRHHGQLARLELPAQELRRFMGRPDREELVQQIKACGFLFVCLDLEGLRSGSLNTMLRVIS